MFFLFLTFIGILLRAHLGANLTLEQHSRCTAIQLLKRLTCPTKERNVLKRLTYISMRQTAILAYTKKFQTQLLLQLQTQM